MRRPVADGLAAGSLLRSPSGSSIDGLIDRRPAGALIEQERVYVRYARGGQVGARGRAGCSSGRWMMNQLVMDRYGEGGEGGEYQGSGCGGLSTLRGTRVYVGGGGARRGAPSR